MSEMSKLEGAAGRAIVTYGRSLMSLVVAHSLGSRGVEVIGCDDVGMTVLSFSRYVRGTFLHAPVNEEPERFLDDIEEQVRAHAPDDDRPYVLMPVFRETKLLARHRERFEPTIRLAAPSTASIDAVHPKDHLAANVESWGVSAPRTLRPASWEELGDRAGTLTYPLLLKPADGVGGRGIVKIDDAGGLRKAIDEGLDEGRAPPMAQEFAEGDDYCVTVLADDGALKAAAAYRNVLSFPRDAGAGAMRETIDHRPFLPAVRRIVEATRWNGVAEIDFRWTGRPGDEPVLIEVNPRFWAGLFHSVESGVDFPWLLYQMITTGQVDEAPAPEVGGRTKVDMVWLLAAVQDVAASDPHFEAVGEAWDSAKEHLAEGEAFAAFRDMAKAAGRAVTATEAMGRLGEVLSEGRGAASELLDADDPFVGLGALFVLGSLMRHGKLPPEITYKPPSPSEASDGSPAAPAALTRTRRRRRPVIGVTKPESGDNFAYEAMKFAVWLAGGRAVKVTARAPRDPHTIDGLIFGGGSDVFPDRYGGSQKTGYRYDLARDGLEASWADAARRHDLPVLGVCRGAQMLNVLAGGTLHADVRELEDGHYPTSFFHHVLYRKPITLAPESQLAALTGADELDVNSIHTQGINRLGDGLVAVGREANGLVQAIEDPSHRFWLGVQFHPEFLIYRSEIRAIFRGLVEAARRTRAEADDDERTPAEIGLEVSAQQQA